MGVTLLAKQLITQSLAGSTFTAPSHVAWGDSSTVFDAESTSLGSEVERNAYDTRDLQSQTIEWVGLLTTLEANGTTITEAGLFNAASNGDMFLRNTFDGIEKTNAFEIETHFIMRVK